MVIIPFKLCFVPYITLSNKNFVVVKHKHTCLEFEHRLLIPFSMIITITPSVPPQLLCYCIVFIATVVKNYNFFYIVVTSQKKK